MASCCNRTLEKIKAELQVNNPVTTVIGDNGKRLKYNDCRKVEQNAIAKQYYFMENKK